MLGEKKDRESFFLLDEEEQDRTIFRVRSFGFDHQRFIGVLQEAPVERSRKGPDHRNEEPGGVEPSKTKYGSLHRSRNDCLLCDSETPGSHEAALGGTGL